MPVARVIEISSTSEESFHDAIQTGISRTSKTLRQVRNAWVKEQEVEITDGQITAYKVNLLVTFVLEETTDEASVNLESVMSSSFFGG